MLVGLDGATFDVIKGLPNFEKIINSGYHGTLKSTIPPFSPVAWTSMATGNTSARHGIYGFTKFGKSYVEDDKQIISSKEVKCKRVWEHLNLVGKKCGIINLLVTYPPLPIKEFMFSGWFAPEASSYPPDLVEKIDYKPSVFEDDKNFFEKSIEVAKNRRDLAIDLWQKYDLDFEMVVFVSTETTQHFYWFEPEKIRKIYREIDKIIGDLYDFCQKNGINMVIASDHGFGEVIEKNFYFNTWLEKEGYLKRKKSLLDKLPKEKIASIIKSKKLKSVGKKIHHPLSSVNWDKTVAYFPSSEQFREGIRINLKGREPRGTVNPGDYDKTLEEIIKKLNKIEYIERVWKASDLKYDTNQAPDILIKMKPGYRGKRSIENKLTDDCEPEATHTSNGIFIANGPDIKTGIINNANIIDVTPTILSLFKIPLPKSMEGKILNIER